MPADRDDENFKETGSMKEKLNSGVISRGGAD